MAISKKLTKQLNDVEKLIVKEGEKWLDIVMCSTIIVMWRYYGWRTDRISKLIKYHEAVWNEVGADNSKSVLKLLDEECDIELTNHEGVSYRNVIFLNSDIDDGRMLTPYQWLYMRTNQIKWLETQITGSIALAIHRKEGWGFKRIKELLIHLQNVKYEFNYDRRRILDACYEETGYDWEGRTQIQTESDENA
ncbi:MAG: hypothetical protein J6S67_24060 [Methanobrevibacter sp.]|nr:hypothetical protein [Methanobrevibacter sp.]